MSKLIAALALTAAICAGCDVSSDVATTSPGVAPRASSTGSVASSSPVPSASATATSAPATQAPAPPPPAPPKPAPTITAVPTRGARGSTFVLQFVGFPSSAQGVDIIQMVTLPTGAKLPPKTFLARPDGTGFTTYTPNVSDPSGQYVVTLQTSGGGVSAFTVITVF